MLGDKSAYHDDLFSLFGDPDGFNPGYIGNAKHKVIRWDWGINGLKKVMKYIYFVALNRSGDGNFERWYSKEQKYKFPESSPYFSNIIYIFRYRDKTIPAFFAITTGIEKEDGRLWFSFTPKRYFLLPPSFLKDYRDMLFSGGREDPGKWSRYLGLNDKLSKHIFSSAAGQDLYHIMPNSFINEWLQNYVHSGSLSSFIADVEDNKKRLKLGLNTNNQIFWDIFQYYIGKTQVRAKFQIKYLGVGYEISEIPVNSIVDGGLVYLHEGGTPKIISEALKEVFGKKYIDLEFPSGVYHKTLKDSIFIKRAVKVIDLFPDAYQKYANTDYDYVLDLSPLGIEQKIGFDLTCGLWHKGRLTERSKNDYIDLWRNNIFEIPSKNEGFLCIWHYGLQTGKEHYKNMEVGEFLTRLYSSSSMIIKRATVLNSSEIINFKTIALPFYKNEKEFHNLDSELNNFDPLRGEVQKTILYEILKRTLLLLDKSKKVITKDEL